MHNAGDNQLLLLCLKLKSSKIFRLWYLVQSQNMQLHPVWNQTKSQNKWLMPNWFEWGLCAVQIQETTDRLHRNNLATIFVKSKKKKKINQTKLWKLNQNWLREWTQWGLLTATKATVKVRNAKLVFSSRQRDEQNLDNWWRLPHQI